MVLESPEVIEIADESFQNGTLELVELSSSFVGSIGKDVDSAVKEDNEERQKYTEIWNSSDNTPSSPYRDQAKDVAREERMRKRSNDGFDKSREEPTKKAKNDMSRTEAINPNSSFLNLSNWISETDEVCSRRNSVSDMEYLPSQKSILDKENISENTPSKKVMRKETNSCLSQIFTSDPISESSFTSLSPKNVTTRKTSSKPSKKPKSIPKKKKDTSAQYRRELREANKVTRTKEELLGEMKVIISKQLYNNFEIDYLEKVFCTAQIDFSAVETPIIYWVRKSKATYDPKTDIFVPCPPAEIVEKNIVLYYKAGEFMNKVANGHLQTDIKSALKSTTLIDPENKLIVIVEGYDQYLLKLKNLEDKKYKDAVMKKLNPEEVRSQRKKKADDMLDLSAKDLECMIYKAQVDYMINVFPVRSNKEAIEWLLSFTYTIASSIYDKHQRNHTLSNLGNVKSGTDAKSTFIQAMRQFKLMTEPRAEKLHGAFGTIYDLYKQYQVSNSLGLDAAGKNIVPPTTDSAMKKFFTSLDPQEIIHD